MGSLPTTRPGDVIRQLASEMPGDLRISPARLAAAYRERERRSAAVSRPAPTVLATSRRPCPFCHVPGFRGCAHFLPFEPPAVPDLRERISPPDGQRASVLRGGGIVEERHPIYDLIVAFCEREGITPYAFGIASRGDADLVVRLRLGSQPKPETVDAIWHYIDENGGPA